MAAGAITLNGSTQFGTISAFAGMSALTAYTIEGWFKQHSGSADFRVALGIGDTGSGFFTELQRDNSAAAGVNFGTGYSTTNADGFASSTGPFVLDTYAYVAMTFDPAGDKKTHIYWTNSGSPLELSYSLQNTASGTENSASGFNFYLGKLPADSGSGLWLGDIGGFIRIWNSQLSLGTLQSIYNLSLQSAHETGLIVNLNFTDGSGATVTNETGANNMALTGTPTWNTSGPTITAKSYGGGGTTQGFSGVTLGLIG